MKYWVVATGILVFLLALTPISDFDIWFHLAEGRIMLEERRFPYLDEFSFTATGAPSYPNSWGFTAASYALTRAFGVDGLNTVKAVTVAGIFSVMAAYAAWRKELSYIWLAYAAVIFFVIRENLSLRPHTFAYIPLVVFLVLLEEWRRHRDKRVVWGLVATQVLWVNLHASFLWGIALAGFTFIETWIKTKQTSKPAIYMLVGISIASLLHSFYGHTFIVRIVQEFFTPGAYQVPVRELLPITLADIVSLRGLIILPGVVFAANAAWRRRQYAPLAGLAFFIILASRSVRFVPDLALYVLFTTSLYAPALEIGLQKKYHWYSEKFAKGVLVSLLLVTLLAARNTQPRAGTNGIMPFTYPVQAVQYITDTSLLQKSGGNIYNTYNFGGYLMWALPQHKVFIDGRLRPYHNGTFQRYWDNFSGTDVWQDTIQRYNITVALMRTPHIEGNEVYDVSAAMFPQEIWAPIYMDDVAVLYVRRMPELEAIIDQYELQYLDPQQLDVSYLQNRISHDEDLQAAFNEIDRAIGQAPGSFRLHFTKAFLYNLAGQPAAMREELETALRINPQFEQARIILGSQP